MPIVDVDNSNLQDDSQAKLVISMRVNTRAMTLMLPYMLFSALVSLV